MMLSRFFAPEPFNRRFDVALLLLRLFAGGYMCLNAYWKLFGGTPGPMAWNPNFPAWLLFLGAFAEVMGGAALVVGALSRLAAFGTACLTGVAAFVQHLVIAGDPFVRPRMLPQLGFDWPSWLAQVGTQGGNYAFAGTLFAVSMTVLLVGPGRISLDALLFRPREPQRRASFLPA
jgi:putative oxidoreductase